MPSTSLHLSEDLLQAVTRAAARAGIPRNRFIVEALEAALEPPARDWPRALLTGEQLSARDLAELRRDSHTFERAIASARRSRRSTPFEVPSR